MKAQALEDSSFKPVTISLVLESEEELQYMWHILNHSYDTLKETIRKNYHNSQFYEKLLLNPSLNALQHELWEVINSEMYKRGVAR